MKYCATFFLIAAAVLQVVVSQQTTGSSTNADESNPLLVLQNGFQKLAATVVAAENVTMNGLSKAREIVNDQPKAALELAEKRIHDSEALLFEAGSIYFYSIAKALDLSNDGSREGLVEASQEIQTTGLDIFRVMRTTRNLAIQGQNIGGKAANQTIEAIYSSFEAAFAPAGRVINLSHKLATQAIENAQSNPLTKTVANRIVDAGTEDSDAVIAELNKAAAVSIGKGASESKVTRLSKALEASIVDLEEVALSVRSNLLKTENQSIILTETEFLKDSIEANKRIEAIFTNICLDFGLAGANLTEKQMENVFTFLQYGNVEISYGNDIARQMVLSALSSEKDELKLTQKAAVQVSNIGIVALDQRIVEAAKLLFANL